MIKRTFQFLLAATALFGLLSACGHSQESGAPWQDTFAMSSCNLVTTGRNPFFVLEPGFQLVFEGGGKTLHITVLDETRKVDGVLTRVVEEREWKRGKLYEVAKNYFAMCEQTKDVYYFGEDVSYYENDKVVKNDGTWLAGVNGSRAGLAMPGSPRLNMKYYQELAPGIAMDRAEIVGLNETCRVPAGTFSGCLKVQEGSAMDKSVKEFKYYAPGIGLVRDDDMQLVKHGFIKGK